MTSASTAGRRVRTQQQLHQQQTSSTSRFIASSTKPNGNASASAYSRAPRKTTAETGLGASANAEGSLARRVSATKNLRAISLSLVAKVRSRRVVTSTEVANELAREAVTEVLGDSTRVPQTELSAIEKNIRRRLYDSLKVLVSVGAITRARRDKTLSWNGVAHLAQAPGLRGRVAAARERVRAKREAMRHLRVQSDGMKRLCERNRKRDEKVLEKEKLRLPFVVVRTPERTSISLNSTEDAHALNFEFDEYFEVVNDSGIILRLFPMSDAERQALCGETSANNEAVSDAHMSEAPHMVPVHSTPPTLSAVQNEILRNEPSQEGCSVSWPIRRAYALPPRRLADDLPLEADAPTAHVHLQAPCRKIQKGKGEAQLIKKEEPMLSATGKDAPQFMVGANGEVLALR